jgi:hypothetical protein
MPRIVPQTEDEQTPGMTPLSASYKPQIQSTMDKLANRKRRFTEELDNTPTAGEEAAKDAPALLRYADNPTLANTLSGPIGVAANRLQREYEMGTQGHLPEVGGQAAVIVNPADKLAKFTKTAFPKMYEALDKSPQEWSFMVNSRRNTPAGLPNLYNIGAAGGTTPPSTILPGNIMLRENVWNAVRQPIIPRLYAGSETALAHELQHALQYGKTPPGLPAAGLPAAQTRGQRLRDLFTNAAKKDKTLPDFMDQYRQQNLPLPYAIREGLTEAAGRSATRNARNTGRWSQAVKESK